MLHNSLLGAGNVATPVLMVSGYPQAANSLLLQQKQPLLSSSGDTGH
jgi:hypothetical protein